MIVSEKIENLDDLIDLLDQLHAHYIAESMTKKEADFYEKIAFIISDAMDELIELNSEDSDDEADEEEE